MEVDGTGSGSCSVVDFHIDDVESSGSVTTVSVKSSVGWYDTFIPKRVT
jgi:hypothetical protein